MKSKRVKQIYMVFSLIVVSFSLLYSFTQHTSSLGIVDYLADSVIDLISATSYVGITSLMVLESACIPIPSEVIMPFSGYLSYVGELSLPLVVASGTIGNLIGSLIAYYIGFFGGRAFIEKYGRYVFLGGGDLERAEEWFRKYGDITVLLSRVTPALRTVISLPAGVGRMDLRKFAVYTFLGSIPWNILLTYFGFTLGGSWAIIEEIFQKLDLTFILVLILAFIYYLLFLASDKRVSEI